MISNREIALNESIIEKLSGYELWQLEKYGTVINGQNIQELENGVEEAEYFARQSEHNAELQLLNDQR